jgi:hypothetical protein
MSLRLNGSTSGYTELDAPAVAGSNTLVLPTGNGTADQVISTNGSGALSFVDRGRMVLETAKASTSGTSVDFTGIPSWVKRVTVMFSGVSTNSTSPIQIQVGTSTGFATTGYLSHSGFIQSNAVGSNTSSGGYVIVSGAASDLLYGSLVVATFGSNIWNASGCLFRDASTDYSIMSTGTVTLSNTLDRIRITTVNGTDTFDAGSVNLLLEG